MTRDRDTLMLLDSASLYFRAYFGVPVSSALAPDGTPVNAVRGFLDFIARLVSTYRPAHLVACWDDDWRPQFRVDAIPSYKAHRVVAEGTDAPDVEEVPDTLAPQVPLIAVVLAGLGIARVGSPGYEADDVIGTLAARATGPVIAVTGDRDIFQIVDDARDVRVLYTAAKGVANAEVIDEAAVSTKYGIPGRAYADFAVLRGDPSDGLPGVKGVGDKTAASLISTYGSLVAVMAAVASGDLTGSVAARITAAADYLAVAPKVVAVATDCPLPAYDARIPTDPADAEALVALADRWNLTGSVNRVLNALAQN